jgi:hypothetical protein
VRPPFAARRPSAQRVRALVLLFALALAACGNEAPAPESAPDDRVVVMLGFEGMAYVEAGAPTRKVAERLRHGTQSVFTTLRKADVMITQRKQADVDLARLEKEQVTVVDPATGSTRAATRLRHRVTALALVPKALADQGEMAIGLLHDAGGARAEAILADCTANGEAERAALGELWTVFDASRPSCTAAITREHDAIVAARKALKRPEKEIVPLELERAYVPAVVTLTKRHAVDGGMELEPPSPDQHVEAKVKVRVGAWAPSPSEAPQEGSNDPVYITRADKEREEEFERDEQELELARAARANGPNAGAPPPSSAPAGVAVPTYPYLQPNYAILYVAIGVVVLLLVGKRKR